jgi:uncharacterized protein (DUF488 family)
MPDKPTIYTIGHSTHPLEEFIGILQNHGIEFLVDVRIIPRSRTNPQFNKDSVPVPLKAAGIDYRHIAELGGLRSRQKSVIDSPNAFWENKSFRNYADYAMTETFRKGLEELKNIAAESTCAIMCAEAVWWRCHRRIIADYLLVEGYQVFHIMGLDKAEPAKVTSAVINLKDDVIWYE